MRTWYAFAAAWFAIVAAPDVGFAQVAQQLPRDVQVTPQRTIPSIDPAVRVPTESEAEAARKIAVARTLGLLIADAAALQPSLWLTPRQPWAPSGAGLTIVNEFQTTPTYAATATMPHGFITLAANPPTPSVASIIPGFASPRENRVKLIDIPNDPRHWFLVECIVSGAEHYNIFAGFGNAAAPSVRRERLRADGGRIAAAFAPTPGPPRWFAVDGYVRRESPEDRTQWQFGGCEITPVRG